MKKKQMTGTTRLQWTLRESYKVNKLLSRETRLHLNIQLSLLSQSMKDVFISIPITSLRFISITWARSLEPANCSAKQCQWHFKGSQRVFDGILMLSGFGGFQSRAWWAGGFEVRQQWQNVTYPAHHQRHHAPTLFLQSAGSGLKKLCTTWIRVGKIPHWWLKEEKEGGWGFKFSSSLTFKFLSGQNLPWSL